METVPVCCPKDGSPVVEDLVFGQDMHYSRIQRRRFYGLSCGHSIYVEAPTSRPEPQPDRTCSYCGEPIPKGTRVHEECRVRGPRRVERVLERMKEDVVL